LNNSIDKYQLITHLSSLLMGPALATNSITGLASTTGKPEGLGKIILLGPDRVPHGIR
jgi:hypothetical protein